MECASWWNLAMNPNSGKPLHIALVAPGWPLGFPNGVVTYVHHLRSGLLELGHRVSVFVHGASSVEKGVHLVQSGTVSRAKFRVWSALRKSPDFSAGWLARAVADSLLRVHDHDPIDVVEMEESFGVCHHVERFVSIPLVVKLHGPAFLTLAGNGGLDVSMRRRIDEEGVALRQARVMMAPSQDTADRTVNRYGISQLVPTVVRNPISLDIPWASLWNVESADQNAILYVGRFDYIKGADVLLRAFCRMLVGRPGLRLMMVGAQGGTIDVDGQAMTLDSCIAQWFTPEQRGRIEVLGQRSQDEIIALRAVARVCVVCSRWESQSNVALEAMAQGCPVVATRAGALPELMIDGQTGLLADSADTLDLEEKVLQVIDDDLLAKRIGAGARSYVRRVHAPRNVAAETVGCYREAISLASHGRS
jgi:glycosyltransferase involved in cell wall biosynthesis